MTDLLDVLRAVPIDALRSIPSATPDLLSGLDSLEATGATVANVGLVAKDGGFQIVILPLEEEDDEECDWLEDEWEDTLEGDAEDEDEGPTGLAGLLDRLRAVFGKALSFQSENAAISRNRKRAAARGPHEFQPSTYATRKGVMRCRVCGMGAPKDGITCAGRVGKDLGAMTGYDLGMPEEMPEDDWPLGELTLRSAALAEAYCMIEDALGQWSQPDAHYMEQSPFVADGYACANCVAYCPEMACCDWVSGEIAADGLCKLNVIPDALRKAVAKSIVERDGQFCVTSSDGATTLGCYATEAEAQARLAQVERSSKATMKTENGEQFPAEAFAYVPDPEMPSSWKLRLWETNADRETARQVGAALAALGPSGFRGNRVEIPADGLAGVKARVRDAWRKVHPDRELPPLLKADTFAPPEGVQAEAQRALDWLAAGEAGSGFTDVGRARASALAAGRGVSADVIRRMASYLARHEVDKQGEGFSPGEPGYPSAGRVAWAAWGGDPAVSWTRSILASLEKGDPDVGAVHVDVPLGSDRGKRRKPTNGSAEIPSILAKAEAQRFTLGPWYVPDAYDAHGEWTDATELQSALWDYVRNADRSIMLQHDTSMKAGEWVEAMTWPYPVTVPMTTADGSTVDHEFPAGTVFMGVIWEPYAWDLVQQGAIRGYSMGGRGQRVAVDLNTEGV